MFQFPGLAPSLRGRRNRFRRVAPFGNPRFNGYVPLHAAYRSLSRPSSLPRAKASFMCPSLLYFYRTLFHNDLIYRITAHDTAALVLSDSTFEMRFVSRLQHVNLRSVRKTLSLPEVENNGFEPLTPCLQSRCSSQLS